MTKNISQINIPFKISKENVYVANEVEEWMRPKAAGVKLLNIDDKCENIFYYANNSLYKYNIALKENHEILINNSTKADYPYKLDTLGNYLILYYPGYEWVSADLFILKNNSLVKYRIKDESKYQ